MLIFLFLVFLFLLGVIFSTLTGKYYRLIGLGYTLIIISTLLFFMALMTMVYNHWGTFARIEQFKSTQKTYEIARKNVNTIETAAIQVDIATQNRWLVNAKYWNNTIFDIWYPDKIINLKLIK